jgi:hypothetical protein
MHMAKKEIFLLVSVVAVALAGCNSTRTFSSAPAPSAPVIHSDGVWLRTDGQSGRENPALAAKFESDKAACTVSGGIQRACMTQRGYILVPQEQAAATAEKLRSQNPSMQQQLTVQ